MLAWVSLRCLRQASLAAAARASLCLATLSESTLRAGEVLDVLAVLNQPGRACEYGVAALITRSASPSYQLFLWCTVVPIS